MNEQVILTAVQMDVEKIGPQLYKLAVLDNSDPTHDSLHLIVMYEFTDASVTSALKQLLEDGFLECDVIHTDGRRAFRGTRLARLLSRHNIIHIHETSARGG